MRLRLAVVALLLLAEGRPAHAQVASSEDLAEQLANPISSLISVPFQYNFDCCFGPSGADRHVLNIQPVIPTKLNADWNLIIRTILPVVYLESPAPGLDSTFGLSDTLQSFFFSPRNTPGGVTWGVGPAIVWPTGTLRRVPLSREASGPLRPNPKRSIMTSPSIPKLPLERRATHSARLPRNSRIRLSTLPNQRQGAPLPRRA